MRSSASVAMGALPLTYNRAEAAPAKCQRHCAANAVGFRATSSRTRLRQHPRNQLRTRSFARTGAAASNPVACQGAEQGHRR
jgi:hypothetical protein